MVAAAMTSTMALAAITGRGGLARTPISERIFRDEEAADQHRQEASGDERQPLLDEIADRLAIITQALGLEEEAGAARDDGKHEEGQKVIAGKARGDGHNLVGDGRHALDQDDPGAPFGVGRAKGVDALAIAIDRDQPMADRVVEQRADGVADEAAEHRGDGADQRVEPRLVRLRQRHGHKHHVGRDGEEGAFSEGDYGQRGKRMAALGKRDYLVVEPPQHGACLAGRGALVHRLTPATGRMPRLTARRPYPMFRPMPQWRNGRRGRLKICCLQGRAGSSPAWGTIPLMTPGICFAPELSSVRKRQMKSKTFLLLIGSFVFFAPHAASAETVNGSGALTLAALVGTVSPLLSGSEKGVLRQLLDGPKFAVPAGKDHLRPG